MEQKCTLEKLIRIFNKIAEAMGYGRIVKITLFDNFNSITFEEG